MAQCYRCQEWGHPTSNCFASPRGTHCAEEHWTFPCTEKTKKKKCAHCNKAQAYSTECPVGNSRLAFIKKETKDTKQKPKYIEAPPHLQQTFGNQELQQQ